MQLQGVSVIKSTVALSAGQRFIDVGMLNAPMEVVGVFERAVNLDAGGEIFSILSADAGRSQSAVVVENAGGLGLRIGDTLNTIPGQIQSRDVRVCIDLSHTTVWNGRIDCSFKQTLSPESVSALKAITQRHSPFADAQNSCYDGPLSQAVATLRSAPTDAVRALAGLGRGLTPSGDDILLGFTTVLNHFHADDECLSSFHNEIASSLHATTALSAQLLKNALKYEYHEYIEDMLIALSGAPEAVGPAATRLLRMGASSGADIAAGMLYAAEWILRGLRLLSTFNSQLSTQ